MSGEMASGDMTSGDMASGDMMSSAAPVHGYGFDFDPYQGLELPHGFGHHDDVF